MQQCRVSHTGWLKKLQTTPTNKRHNDNNNNDYGEDYDLNRDKWQLWV